MCNTIIVMNVYHSKISNSLTLKMEFSINAYN